MLDSFVANANQYIHTNPWLALIAVFVGGILTASNPCVLAMIPLMMSFVAGRKDEKTGVLRAFLFSLVFIFGLAMTFTVLGMIAAPALLRRISSTRVAFLFSISCLAAPMDVPAIRIRTLCPRA